MSIDWADANYQKRQVITLDPPDANLEDKDVLLKLTDTEQIANADMASKRYAIYDWLGNELPYEEESYAEGASYVNFETWCKVPDLYASPSGDQNCVVVYYDYDPGTDQDDAANVWDSYYKSVYHLNQVFTDSTSNAQTLTDTDTDDVTGKIAQGRYCDGTNEYLTRADDATQDIGLSDLTLSCCVKLAGNQPETAGADRIAGLVGKGFLGNVTGYGLDLVNERAGVQIRTAAVVRYVVGTTDLDDGQWHHIAASVDRDNANGIVLLVDGASEGTANPTALQATNINNALQFTVGTASNGLGFFYDFFGTIDEVRLSIGIARNTSWNISEYHNIFDADNAQTWGGEETAAAYTAAAAATIGAITAAVNSTFAEPIYDADVAGTIGAITAAVSATFTVPEYAATAAGTIGAITAAVSATFAVPVYEATIGATAGAPTASVSAAFVVPVYAATATATIAPATAAVSATFAVPVYSATIAATIDSLTAALAATFAVPVYTGTAAALCAPAEAAVSATFTIPVYAATAIATVNTIVAAVSATFVSPIYTATVAATVGSPSAQVSATSATTTYAATVSAALAPPTAVVNALFISPVYAGIVEATCSPAIASVSASSVLSVYGASIAARVQPITASTQAAFASTAGPLPYYLLCV